MGTVTDIHPLQGKFKFTNVGRGKANFVVDLNGEKDFFRAVQPHLMSRDIGYDYDPEMKAGLVDAGGRVVGTFQRIGERG